MSIKKQLVSGVLYTGVAKYLGIVVSLIVAGILARMIDVDDFGVVAIATVVIAFLSVFSDLGFSPAIVQHGDLNKHDLSNIFSFTVWLGVAVSALFFILSPFVAAYYQEEQLIIICRLLSLNLLFSCWNIVPNALLYKNKLFKFIAYRNFSIQLLGGLFSVLAVFNGFGIYALLINPIFTSVLYFVVCFIQYPQRFRAIVRFDSIKKILSFSIFQFLFNMINYFSRNMDKLLIGRFLGMGNLGYYEKSYRLMMLPLENITYVINPVMLPIFSEYQHDLSRLSHAYFRVIRLLSFLSFPLSLLLFYSSREIILLIFGLQWEPSVPVFKILSLSLGFQIIVSTAGAVFQAANSTKILFLNGVVTAFLNIAGMLIGLFLFGTMEAVAWAILFTFTANFFITYFLMCKMTFRQLKEFKRLLGLLVSPLCLSFMLGVMLFLLSRAMPSFLLSTTTGAMIANLIIKSTVVLILVGLYLQLVEKYDVLAYIGRVINRRTR